MLYIHSRLGPGDPLRTAITQRRAPVQAHAHFQLHPRALALNAGEETSVQLTGRLTHQSHLDLDTGRFEFGDALAVDLLERVFEGHHDLTDATFNQCLMACPRAANVAARLQRDVGRGAFGQGTGLAQGEHFCVRATGPPMPTFAHHTITVSNHTAHPRVGPCGMAASFGQRQRVLHVLKVDFGEISHDTKCPPARAAIG